jgi:hypothetical protein
MVEVTYALVGPLAKLILKSWLGDTAADVGDNLLKLGLKRFGDWKNARDAEQRARQIAEAVSNDLSPFLRIEGVPPERAALAASDVGDAISGCADGGFLVSQHLDSGEIRDAILQRRPSHPLYTTHAGERDLFELFVEAAAPRLRKIAPGTPEYGLERDALLLKKMTEVAEAAPAILASIADLVEEARRTTATIENLAGRQERAREEYEGNYRKAVRNALDYVEILGLDIDPRRRQTALSIAYLSLTTSTTRLGRLSYEALLDVLPAIGNRLLIKGAAGSGKSTLLRWTAVEASRKKAPPVEAATGIGKTTLLRWAVEGSRKKAPQTGAFIEYTKN